MVSRTFSFAKIFDCKVRKLHVSVVNDYADNRHANFSLDTDVFIFLNYSIPIGFVNTPKYLFPPDCSFKNCEKPQKFSNYTSTMSIVRVVNDHADAVSV